MGDISEHISTKEIVCPGTSCGYNGQGCKTTTHDIKLNQMLEGTCDRFLSQRPEAVRVALEVLSGNRCIQYDHEMKTREGINFDPNGKPTEHSNFHAMDFSLEWVFADGKREKIPDEDIADYLEAEHPNDCGIGRYNNRNHLDSRRNKARWDNRSRK